MLSEIFGPINHNVVCIMTNCRVIFVEPMELTLTCLWQLIVDQLSSAGLCNICFAAETKNIDRLGNLFSIKGHVTWPVCIKIRNINAGSNCADRDINRIKVYKVMQAVVALFQQCTSLTHTPGTLSTNFYNVCVVCWSQEYN